MTSTIEDLPDEILHLVLSLVPPIADLRRVSQTSRCLGRPARLQLRILRILAHPALGTLSCPPDCAEETCDTEYRLRRVGADPCTLLLKLSDELGNEDALSRASKTQVPRLTRMLDDNGVDTASLVYGEDNKEDLEAVDVNQNETLNETTKRVLERLRSERTDFWQSDLAYLVVEVHSEAFAGYVSILNRFAEATRTDIFRLLVEFRYAEPSDSVDTVLSPPAPLDPAVQLKIHQIAAAEQIIARASFLSRATKPDIDEDALASAVIAGDAVTSILFLVNAFMADESTECLVLPSWLTETEKKRKLMRKIVSGSVVDQKILTWRGENRIFLSKRRFDEVGLGDGAGE